MSTESKSSPKKLVANRANAKKSTGPKTAAGKEKSSQNSWKHGYFTRRLFKTPEQETEDMPVYMAIRDGLFDRYRPFGLVEEFWTDRVAAEMLRSLRLVGHEQESFHTLDLLSLEEAVRRAGNRSGAAAKAAAGRKCEAEEVGSRAESGQDDVAGCARKKIVKPSRRRPVVNYLGGVYQVSQRRACQVARIPVSTFRYQSTQEPRTALRLRIREIAQARIRYGYRKIRVLLKREGWNVGKKLVYRLYREEGLALRYKPRRRRCAAANRRERSKATAPNQAWSLDFVADQLADGRRFRALTIVDVFTRESLAIEAGQSLKGDRCGARTEPNLLEARHSENAFLRQRIGVHQPSDGSMGVSCRCEDRFFAAGKADRQRVCGIVQRDPAGGVLGRPLVRNTGRGEAGDRSMAAGI